MRTVLITGATGFLGSHIAEELVNQGFEVVALKRSTSDLWRCLSFKHKIHWIDLDDLTEAESNIINYNPEILIHAAWAGVKAEDRDNWILQEKNLLLLALLFEIVKKTAISKIIALGSQAEYGYFEGSVDEKFPCNPISAYGASKLCASLLVKSFAEQNQIDWYWIRLFSIFGPREEGNWLIPSTINNLLGKRKMDLTPCEQQYDYLFTKDFATGILSVIKNSRSISGIYNFSSGKSIKIKEILDFLENRISPSEKVLQIGALPYRPKQVMCMQGNSDLFFQSFSFQPRFSVYEGLEQTINYYMSQNRNEQRL